MENPFVNYKKIIADTNSQMFNVRDEFKNNTVEENQTICKSDRLPFSVGMINVTGDLNIGMAARSACLMGAENFYIFGRRKFDARSTVGAENYINIQQFVYDDPTDMDEQVYQDVVSLYLDKHEIILCEHGGDELGSFSWKDMEFKTPKYTPLFLFGSESSGLPACLGENPDFYKVSIPQRGVLRSFNVSAACNIILWSYIQEMYL